MRRGSYGVVGLMETMEKWGSMHINASRKETWQTASGPLDHRYQENLMTVNRWESGTLVSSLF